MKEITLKFYGLGINHRYQAEVLIYDNKELIYEGKTYNGYLNVCLKNHHYYKIKAIACGDIINSGIYVNKTIYTFSFKRAQILNNTITFILTDTYYNLPIEKGFVILWPR